MMAKDKPRTQCKGCEERHTGCHSSCPKYREFLQENEKEKAELYKTHEYENMLYDYSLKKHLRRRKK